MIVGSVVLGFAGMYTDKFLCYVLRLCRINGDGSQVGYHLFASTTRIKSGYANLCKQKFQVKAYLGSETFDIFLRSLYTGNSQLAE